MRGPETKGNELIGSDMRKNYYFPYYGGTN
jgi:hypothetical protein